MKINSSNIFTFKYLLRTSWKFAIILNDTDYYFLKVSGISSKTIHGSLFYRLSPAASALCQVMDRILSPVRKCLLKTVLKIFFWNFCLWRFVVGPSREFSLTLGHSPWTFPWIKEKISSFLFLFWWYIAILQGKMPMFYSIKRQKKTEITKWTT